jgi:hypothetical protein
VYMPLKYSGRRMAQLLYFRQSLFVCMAGA